MKKIKVYSTPTCPWCYKLEEYLQEKKIEFEKFDVSLDDKAKAEMIKKSGELGVPQIDIEGKIILGFDPEAIEAELKKKK